MTRLTGSRGVTLIESVVAMAVLATVVGGFAPLLAQVHRFMVRAESMAVATAAARARAESLLAIPWDHGAHGGPAEAPLLAPSPPGSLDRDIDGYHDRLDRSGTPVAAADGGPDALVRRWSVRLLPSATGAVAIEVCVFPGDVTGILGPLVCVATARGRQP